MAEGLQRASARGPVAVSRSISQRFLSRSRSLSAFGQCALFPLVCCVRARAHLAAVLSSSVVAERWAPSGDLCRCESSEVPECVWGLQVGLWCGCSAVDALDLALARAMVPLVLS